MKIELAIKFGSNEIIVYRKGLGIVNRTASYVATSKSGKKVCAYGEEAKYLSGLKSSQYILHEPIQGINIKDTKLATELLKYIISQSIVDNGKISALVAVPCALTEMQLLEIKILLNNAGVDKVDFVQNSVCVRANTQVSEVAQYMVADMGKYLVDISVLTRYDFIMGRNYLIGGANMDEALATYVQDNYGVTISNKEAELVKNELASMYSNDTYTHTFQGIDENDTYKEITMRANEARVAIIGVYEKIFDLIEEVLDVLPSETLAQVRKNGIIFTGGVSSINGLVEYASKRLNMPAMVVDNPKDAVILGAGKLLSLNKGDYPHIKL